MNVGSKLIINFLDTEKIRYEQEIDLSKKTWIKTGGVCSLWIEPDTLQKLIVLCRFLYEKNIEYDTVGQTSNIFFHSSYNPQIIVSTAKVNGYTIKDDILICECGVSVAKLARECLAAGYKGYSGLVQLPGTVGASIYGNASCFNNSICSMLLEIDLLTPDQKICTLKYDELGITRRSSALKRKEIRGIILTAKLCLKKAEHIDAEIRKSEESRRYRKENQEKPSWCLGSIFAELPMRKNIRNKMVNGLLYFTNKCHFIDGKKLKKDILLLLYGFRRIAPYVSDKTINTFIWRDQDAEKMFEEYKTFMRKVYDNPVVEIEEKL